MTCPACGARNTADAAWCTQCFARLDEPAEDPPPPGGPAWMASPRAAPADAPPAGPDGPVADAVPGAARPDRPFRTRDDGEVEWRCEVCLSWNELVVPVCSACGHHLGSGTDPARRGRSVDPALATAATVVVPGAGHVLAGRPATGWARVMVGLLFLLGGVALATSASGGGQSVLPGAVLLLGWAVLWATTLADLRTVLGGGTREVLTARGLLVLLGATIGVLLVSLLLAGLRATG